MTKAIWRPMTDLEKRAALALSTGWVTYPVASAPKRFARHLEAQASCEEPEITDRQAVAMWAQLWRFRRQIHQRDLVEHARRLTMPSVEGAFLQ